MRAGRHTPGLPAQPTTDRCSTGPPSVPVFAVLDLTIRAGAVAAVAVREVTVRVAGVVQPVARELLERPRNASIASPAAGISGLLGGGGSRPSHQGAAHRAALRHLLDTWLDAAIPSLVTAVLDRVDLTAVIQERVDLDALIAAVDVDRVAHRLDVDAVAARFDVDAVMRRVDLDAIVARLDLARLAEEVIDDVDLPEIIRESTGAVASETVQTMRMRSIAADDLAARAVDRLLRRGGRRPSLRGPVTTTARPVTRLSTDPASRADLGHDADPRRP